MYAIRSYYAVWTENDLCGILYNTKIPRASYWAWTEYAAGDGEIVLHVAGAAPGDEQQRDAAEAQS